MPPEERKVDPWPPYIDVRTYKHAYTQAHTHKEETQGKYRMTDWSLIQKWLTRDGFVVSTLPWAKYEPNLKVITVNIFVY